MDWVTTSAVLDGLGDFENREAWARFAERFRTPIVSFARKMGLPGPEAEDAAQETLLAFADAFRRGEYDRTQGRLNKWLFGIAYRQVANARRKLARGEAHVGANADQTSFWSDLPDEDQATESWNAEWHQALLKQCLEQVRQIVEPKTLRAFEMVMVQKKAPADVAGELGITRNAVFIAKHRVLTHIRRLRQEFEQTL